MKLNLSTVAVLLSLIAFTGCQNSYERRAYQTLDTTQTLVEVAMATFKALNISGKVTAQEYDDISVYYSDYQAVMNAAIDAASGDLNQFTPETAMRLSVQLISLIERFENR
jgi:hypothetical protein